MSTYMNFKNFGEMPYNQGTGSEPPASYPLIRQSSVYSLTFDEFQNALGGSGKDFGSMNMDELLKNIWTAEETQAIATSALPGQVSNTKNTPSENLQRQGSLTLPRTISQKTVDEVWKEVFNENSGIKEVSNPSTLGEITLEEFLFRAGVVREDAPQMANSNDNGFYSNSNNTGLSIGFQQSAQSNIGMNNRILDNNNMSVVRPSQQLLQPLFPKQATVNFTSSVPMPNNTQVASPGTRGPLPLVAIADSSTNRGLYQGGQPGMGAKMGAVKGSPVSQISQDGDTSSVSPPSYVLTSGARGRKGGTLEKAMERRHRRMIKNRESAARSRARKQAYTLELEAEVAKLKEMNEELRKKQDEFMETQNNKVTESTKKPWGIKKQCLRRTLTMPW